MAEFPVAEAPVLEILNAVGLAKRTASLRLDETQFGLKSKRNRAKKDGEDVVSQKRPLKAPRFSKE